MTPDEMLLLASTIGFALSGYSWSKDGFGNTLIKFIMWGLAVANGFALLHSLGYIVKIN